jgi:hypothetical protein
MARRKVGGLSDALLSAPNAVSVVTDRDPEQTEPAHCRYATSPFLEPYLIRQRRCGSASPATASDTIILRPGARQ